MRPVNLIPTEERRGAARGAGGSSGIGVYVVLGVLALAVAGVAAMVLTSNKIKDQEAKLARLTRQEQQAKQRQPVNNDFATFEQTAQAQYDTVYSTAKDRFNFARRLRQLTRAVPGDVVISKLGAKLTPDDGGSQAGSQAASGEATAAAGPTFTIEACTSAGKPGVARMATRMRNLDSVIKVTIKKIGISESAATSGTTGTASGSDTTCVKDVNTFEMEVGFQHNTGGVTGDNPSNAIQQASQAAAQADQRNQAAGSDQSQNTSSGGGQ